MTDDAFGSGIDNGHAPVGPLDDNAQIAGTTQGRLRTRGKQRTTQA
jgi:hypothetical protein